MMAIRINVVAAIIRKGSKILIVQRKPDCRREPNKWEFPGGKVEKGESAGKALEREISEELGVDIEVKKLFGESAKEYPERDEEIVLSFYFAKLKGKTELKTENWKHSCQAIRWTTIDELGGYDFADADRVIIRLLMAAAERGGNDDNSKDE